MYQYSDPDFTVPFGIAFYQDKAGKVKYLNYGWQTRIKLE